MKDRAPFYRCVQSCVPEFKRGVAYEVFRYAGDTPIVTTETGRPTRLPIKGACLTPYSPWETNDG